MDTYKNKRGEQLKPLNVGPHTWLLVCLHHIYKNL